MKYYTLFLLIIIFYGCKSDVEEDIPELPVVKIIDVSEITKETALSGGNIIDNGGVSILAKGVCWSTSTNPTINDNRTNDGTGTGEFTSSLFDLTENTTFYIRAYATNLSGTSYSNELSFTTFRVYEGSITLSSQQEVNDFGTENYCEITGDLIIEGNVENLQQLSNLTKVGKSVFIRFSDVISIEGLQNLSYIEGEEGLRIWNNLSLNNLEGLEKLEELRYLEIIENNILQNIDGLINLSSLDTGLFIDNNNDLINLNGLANLASINGSPLSPNGVLAIEDNSDLVDFCGLQTIYNNFEGLVRIRGNGYDPTFNEGECSQ